MKSKVLKVVLASFVVTLFIYQCAAIKDYDSDSKPISHDIWNELLQKNIKENGRTDYKGFIADSVKLYQYLELLNNNHPNKENWTKEERLAYWINAYNAYTVQLIVENYPMKSIKDIKNGIPFINSVWDLKFIKIEGKTYDLNNVEHNILRKKFDEPRLHFAINCASVSCPNLRNEAYYPEKIDQQLDEQARLFLNDSSKNKITESEVELSKIFSWFGKDFKKNGTLIEYINPYTDIEISPDTKKSFLEYDWNLNE
jgi:hypothetical protein